MVYSSHTWSNGDVVHSSDMNALETQYTEVKGTYMDRFSTASTGTILMTAPATATFTSDAFTHFMHIAIPPGIQRSRFELSLTGQQLSGGGSRPTLGLFRNAETFSTIYSPTWLAQRIAAIDATFTTAAAGQTRVASFSAQGGDWIEFGIHALTGACTGFNLWNVKISGTSTTLLGSPVNIFSWTTILAGTPTTAG